MGKGREPARRRRQAMTLTGMGQELAWWQTTTSLLGKLIKLGTIDSIFLLGEVSFCSLLAEELFGKYSRIKKTE